MRNETRWRGFGGWGSAIVALSLLGCGSPPVEDAFSQVRSAALPSAAPTTPDAGCDDMMVDMATCPTGTTLCDGTCVDTSSDVHNCGGCNSCCDTGDTCVMGVCTPPPCDGVNLATDTSNCGACGNACATGYSCVAGVCTPPCGGADLMNDMHNCGSCGTCCPEGMMCVMGHCTPPCGGANLATDTSNCGTCGHVCPTSYSCVAGVCTPPCGGANLATDTSNCGTCGHACPTSYSCVAGVCTPPCGGANLATDTSNCGTCGHVCPTSYTCVAGVCTPPCTPCGTAVSNSSNFNGTPISAGDTIWFSAVIKTADLASGTTIRMAASSVAFTNGQQQFNVPVPGASVTVDSHATMASTHYDAASNTWVTVTPPATSGNTFLTGVALPLPNGLPGGTNPVVWNATFSASVPSVNTSWIWAAAVYTRFATDYNAANVVPTDDNHANPYGGSDHAGTPYAERSYVIGGARGGGGANFTGSLSGTLSFQPPVCNNACQ